MMQTIENTQDIEMVIIMKDRIILLMEIYTVHELASMVDEYMKMVDSIQEEMGRDFVQQHA